MIMYIPDSETVSLPFFVHRVLRHLDIGLHLVHNLGKVVDAVLLHTVLLYRVIGLRGKPRGELHSERVL